MQRLESPNISRRRQVNHLYKGSDAANDGSRSHVSRGSKRSIRSSWPKLQSVVANQSLGWNTLDPSSSPCSWLTETRRDGDMKNRCIHGGGTRGLEIWQVTHLLKLLRELPWASSISSWIEKKRGRIRKDLVRSCCLQQDRKKKK